MQRWGAALLRIMLGVIFVMHGYYGLVVLKPAAVTSMMGGMGVPEPLYPVLAWYLILAHLIGGFLMIIGLWTRWAALAQVPIMVGAVVFFHLSQGFFMRGIVVDAAARRAIAGGYEFPLLVLVGAIAVVLLGPGTLAVQPRR